MQQPHPLSQPHDCDGEGRLRQEYDRLEILSEGDDETEWIEIVTTLRQNVLEGRISKESPLGKAVLGHRVGDHVIVRVDDETSYDVEIRSLEKGTDDGSVPINRF